MTHCIYTKSIHNFFLTFHGGIWQLVVTYPELACLKILYVYVWVGVVIHTHGAGGGAQEGHRKLLGVFLGPRVTDGL